MGLYMTLDDLKKRVFGKISFTDDPEDKNKMFVGFADNLICEAETQVELDLSPRYAAPFSNQDGGVYSTLPDRPTRTMIRVLCELKATIYVMQTDFGRGSINSAEKYIKDYGDTYKKMSDQLIAYREGYGSGWKYPPLPGLKLMWGNAESDNGFVGEVYLAGARNTGADFPERQVNDPSKTFWAPFGIGGYFDDC